MLVIWNCNPDALVKVSHVARKIGLVVELAAVSSAFFDYGGVAELLERHWAEIGIKVDLNIEERSLFDLRKRNNEHQLSLWDTGGSENLWLYPQFTVPHSQGAWFATTVGYWYQSGGAKGEEPTGALKRLLELYDRGREVPFEERVELGREIWRIHGDNLYAIGKVGESPAFNGVVVVKNDFRNVPARAPNNPSVQNPGIARPEQFFFDR